MPLKHLSKEEQDVVMQCLYAVAEGNILAGEYQTRLGVEHEELRQIAAAFPDIDDSDDASKEALAIHNCLNEVCNGIHFSEREWNKWFTVDRATVDGVFRKWKS